MPTDPQPQPMLAERRRGDWIQTFTGRQFWPLDPRPEELDIDDIAHSLSMQCRYAGHCKRFYSVAEHCVLLAGTVAKEHAMWALLHDASEAYLIDVPRPIKRYLGGYVEAEKAVMSAITMRYDLCPEMPQAVHEADFRILTDEMEQNMAAPPVPWSELGKPLGVKLQYWPPNYARRIFLAHFVAFGGRRDVVMNVESREGR